MATIKLGSAQAGPGEKSWGQLRVREGDKSVPLPVVAINGSKPGPHVVVLANQHGGETNGVESIRRFAEAVNPRRLRGTVFAVPSANPRAAMLANECWPEGQDESLIAQYRGCPYLGPEMDRNNCAWNMNRKWPGSKGGLWVERATYELWHRAVMAPHATASLVMDIHCHQFPSSIYAAGPGEVDLGVASGIPNVIFTRGDAVTAGAKPYLSRACKDHGIRAMTVELGGQRTMDHTSMALGERAIGNMLKLWGMLPGEPQYDAYSTILDPWRNDIEPGDWPGPSIAPYTAGHDGLAVVHRRPYELVREDDVVVEILDPFTGKLVEQCRAPMSGAIYAVRLSAPPCHKGDRVFDVCIARRVRPQAYVARLDTAALTPPERSAR